MQNLNDFEHIDNYEEENHEEVGKEVGKEGRSGDVNTHTQDSSDISQYNNGYQGGYATYEEVKAEKSQLGASEGVAMSPYDIYSPVDLDNPIKFRPNSPLAGGQKPKETEDEKDKPLAPVPIPSNHAIFRLPPEAWAKTRIKKDANGQMYLVEDFWIYETIAANNKVNYYYYQADFDIDPRLSWQPFLPKTAIDPNIPVPKEKKDYTAEELEAIDKKRAQAMYAIASSDELFWQYYGNDEYSLAFQKELYLLKIAIGTGKVGKVVGGVGFAFMAAMAAPVIIGVVGRAANIAAPVLGRLGQQGLTAAKGLGSSLKETVPKMLKELPKELITTEVIDKVGEAIGVPLGLIFDLRDAKQFVHDLYKFAVKTPSLKLVTPDGKDLDLDSPMLFSKETDPIKGGNLSGGKKTTWPWTKDKATKAELLKDGGKCFEHAKKIKTEIGGEIIHIQDGLGAPFIGSVYNQKGELITSEWREHYAVRKGDIIYDRITGVEGLHLDEYKKLFEYGNAGLVFDNFIKH